MKESALPRDVAWAKSNGQGGGLLHSSRVVLDNVGCRIAAEGD
ncbi:MAG: hypothetical protein ABII12_13170 [Planctomycetota bacterium]